MTVLVCFYAYARPLLLIYAAILTVTQQRTAEDGQDLAQWLANLFEVLNTSPDKRLKRLDEQLAAFPYVNGSLYAERLPIAAFDQDMRDGRYLLIPSVSSERRAYIPIGFMPSDVVSTNLNLIVPGGELYHLGILSSAMHMAWMRSVCGRLKSDYRYSAGIVYNNFPWPENVTDKQRQGIEEAAQAVLNARARYPGSSLADLYDPLAMPPDLVKAHHKLDAAVDAAYSKKNFSGDSDRVAFLFELYQQISSPLEARKTGRRKLLAYRSLHAH